MQVGPVEYIVLAFPGNQFNGDVVPALSELVEQGLVRILDLVFVKKDADGGAGGFELGDLTHEEASAFSKLNHQVKGLFNEQDLARIAADLPNNSSAALLVWENVWATRFRNAVLDSGGQLLAYDRIPAGTVQAALEYAESEHAQQG